MRRPAFLDRPSVDRYGGRSTLIAILLTALTPLAAQSETIRVGATADGCSHSSLALAWLRAAITPESDTIVITSDQTWTGAVALNLTDESTVTIRGGVSCTDTSPRRRTVTTTVGDLFEFVNTRAEFRDLTLRGDTGGRLITASGTSVITLSDTTLDDGRGTSGGNAHLSGGAALVALDGAVIRDGQADFDGGGVYCTGPGAIALAEGSQLHGNRAAFNGGGVYLTGGCLLNLRSGGPASTGPGHYGIVDNRAEFNGGGVYATGGATVIAAGNRFEPASIRSNTAIFNGGGIYLTGAGTTAEVLSSELVSNRGFRKGGGLYVTAGAELEMDRDLVECDRGVRCSLLDGNGTVSLAGVVTEGGAIVVTGGGQAEIRQTYITDNSAANDARVALVEGSGSFLLIEGSVLYDNDPRGQHVLARGGALARLAFISAWGSSTSGFGMFFAKADAGGRVDLYSSVVLEGNGSAPTGGGPDRVFAPAGTGGIHNAHCVLAHEDGSFPPDPLGTVAVQSNPAFIWDNPTTGDPHLWEFSDALDFCDTSVYSPLDSDIDAETRGEDAPVPDVFGRFDLGADEWRPAAPPPPGAIFADGFETRDTSRWSATVP